MLVVSRPQPDIEGPGKESPVLPDSEQLAPWELPVEHRHDVEGVIVLPDTEKIEQSVYENLGVDVFFSLWFIFFNNKVTVSGKRCTIVT